MITLYTLDSQQSKFTVQAFAAGMLAAMAHNPRFAVRQFEGEVAFDPDNVASSSFSMTVKASSLQLLDTVKEKDRLDIQKTMMDEVLEADQFSDIVFNSSQISATRLSDNWFRLQIAGELSLHGIRKPISIDSQLRSADRDLRLSGEFALALPQYKLKQVTALGGLIKLKEELKFVFDLLGRTQDQG